MHHVDDFIDSAGLPHSKDQDNYARFFFHLHRLKAVMAAAWKPWISSFKLFCTYKGTRYRVTGASRLGDVWLATDFNCESGYDLRVDVMECTEWAPEP